MDKESPSKATAISRRNVFWTSPSTWVVTSIRLVLIILVHFGSIPTTIPHNWLYSPSLTSILIKPSWTLSHVQEALAIQRLVSGHFVDSYQSRRIQLPPLLLAAIVPWAQSPHAKLYLAILCLFLDFGIAFMIESLGRMALFTNKIEPVDQEASEQEQLSEAILPPYRHIFAITPQTNDTSIALVPMESLPILAAQFYYWSPFSTLSGSVYACFQNLPGFLLVATFWEGVRKGGSPWLSTFFLALASYLEMHHVVFLIPFLTILHTKFSASARGGAQQQQRQSSPSPSWSSSLVGVLLSFGFWWGCLHGLSYLLVVPSFVHVLQGTYGLGWKTIRPSLSIQWYLAIQLFMRFRGYFETLLLGLPYIVIVPVTMRLYKYPLVQVATFSMIWTIFRPVETLWDANLSLCFFLLCPRSLARMGIPAFVSICSLGVPVILNVLDHWMWLGPNTGNANYMYFQCLAYNVFLGILLGQFVRASLERDKALRISSKERGHNQTGGASLAPSSLQ